jgi:hypothetical protein
LEVGQAHRLIQCIQKFKQHTLAVEKHGSIYFIRRQTAMPKAAETCSVLITRNSRWIKAIVKCNL